MENNTNQIDTVATSKAGLVTDLNSSYVGKESYSFARNVVRSSKDGDLGTLGNEPSTLLSITAPYKIIGTIDLPDGDLMLFSGDEVNSEIGLGNPETNTYKKLLNLNCLGFSKEYPITGIAKKHFNKGTVVTFTDKNKNLKRVVVEELSNVKDCDDIRLFKKISQPCLTISKGQSGNMPNGSYSIVLAYGVDGKRFSDWYSITNRLLLNSDNSANSINVKIENLDTDFDEFILAVVGNYIDPETKGATKSAKIIGSYSTKVKSVSISDFINSNYTEVQLSELVVKKDTWQKAGIISSNSNLLILGDLVKRNEENYQLKAMSIEAEYVIEQVPLDYYLLDGADVSYYADENYDFYISGVYNTGEETDKFHIPGRLPKDEDMSIVSSGDVYEYDTQFSDCEPEKIIKRYQVENTAGELIPTNDEFKCNRRILGTGELGYFESTELYPDNAAMFGKWANTPIRFHKFPDECKVPRYSVIQGKTYINIKGIRFKNIPKFSDPDIIGYKITRSDRKGGNGTVIARGMMTNVRYYYDTATEQNVMYSSYGVNHIGPDPFLSKKQTFFRNNRENQYEALTEYYKDRFMFYSPHTQFDPKYTLGSEIRVESEEIADITGKFSTVYNHPKEKLMNQFSFWLAASVGFIEATLTLIGKTTYKINSSSGEVLGQNANTHSDVESEYEYPMETVEDLINFDVIGFLTGSLISATGARSGAAAASKISKIVKVIKAALAVISSLALKVPFSILNGIKEADRIFETIRELTGPTDYVYQLNAVAKFLESKCVPNGQKRRRLLTEAKYIPSDVVSIDGEIFNNYFREKGVYLHLNKEIKDPSTSDTSVNSISGFGICGDITKQVKSKGCAYYVTSKNPNPNQYGRLGSSSPVSMHSCVLSFDDDRDTGNIPNPQETLTTSPILYGGDCIIAPMNFQKRMQFFNQNIAGANFPNEIEYDYKLYRNIAYPRYWMDSTKYDFAELVTGKSINYNKYLRTTQSRHNLDCKKRIDGKSITRVDDAYMYLSYNMAFDYIVECDYNIFYREETELPYYSRNNTNLNLIFRQDRLTTPEEFKINRVYSDIYTTEIFSQQQRDDFDPNNPIPVNQPNSVIYSLPSYNLQKADNWQYFLPANFFSFAESDFGKLTAIHKLDEDRVMFLFSKASPFISMGRSLLKLSGQTVTIGDGGLFAQDPREIMPTNNNYGACNSRYAFSNTHLGRVYPSERQGRILSFTEGLDDISRQGVSYWCKNYMPIFLYNYFSSYPKEENPIAGVGYLMSFDSFNETIYISKRDFVPKQEFVGKITYNNGFFYNGRKIDLRDPYYFNDASWTLSYSPLDKSFISWHDWHPDGIVQTDNHFMSIKGNKIWKHNEAWDSYCNFYGVDYPFEIEFLSSSGQTVETVRSLEYILEAYKYKNRGRDRFHVLNENFDRLIVRNTEQISPLLYLTHGNPDPEINQIYPRKSTTTSIGYDIVFFKEENKYRINQFWDSVRDRGEFTSSEVHLFPTDESGYKSVINPMAIDINKPEEQRKKFRHYFNKFRLTKSVSGDIKFLCKLLNIKKLYSSR